MIDFFNHRLTTQQAVQKTWPKAVCEPMTIRDKGTGWLSSGWGIHLHTEGTLRLLGSGRTPQEAWRAAERVIGSANR